MMRIYMADIFAEQRYAGNPLAVVTGGEALAVDAMQLIAAETNYSETVFVDSVPEQDGGYRTRIFTPAREIAFAGHPILGTAWVIRRHVATGSPEVVRLNLSVGQIPVRFEYSTEDGEIAWFQGPQAQFGAVCSREAMAVALGIETDDIESGIPVQAVTAGVSVLIVPVRSLEALRRCKLNLAAFVPLAERGFSPLVYVYSSETHDSRNDLCARFFFEAHGVREDPATGNGAAFLGVYLLEHLPCDRSGLSLRIEQGHQVRRPSLIRLRARMDGKSREVHVGGRIVPTVEGELL